MFNLERTYLVLLAILIASFSNGASAKSFNSPIGEWNDQYLRADGTWYWSTTTFINSAKATYTNPDGQIFFYLTDDYKWEGYWVEDGPDECSEEKYGSKVWGVIVFQFNDDYNKYKGTWDLCGLGKKYPLDGLRI